MVDALYFSAPVGSNGSTAAVKKNLTDSCHFVGYANQADLANIPSFLRTTIGASAYTTDNKLYFLTATAGSGTWTEFTGGGSFTAAGDLSGSSSTQAVVAATGAGGTLPLATTAAIVQWAAASLAPKLKQADVTTNSATGAVLTVQAQSATGTTATGGALALTSGTGTTAAGNVTIATGGTTRITVSPTAITQSLPVTVNSATATSVAMVWQTNSVTRAQVGYDGSKTYFEAGPTANVASIGALRCGQDTVGLAFQPHAGSGTVGAIEHAYASSEDFLYINRSNTGQTSAQNVWVDCTSLIALLRTGGPMAYFYSGGFQLFLNQRFNTTAYIDILPPSGDVVAKDLTIRGSNASSGSTTGTTKASGQVIIDSGGSNGTGGRERGLAACLDTVPLIEVCEVQPPATAASRCVALVRGAAITATQMPTGTGDLVIYIGECAVVPSVNPVSGGILYVEGGALKYRSPGGLVTPIAPNV